MSAPTEIRMSGGVVGSPLHVYVGDALVLRYDGGCYESVETLTLEVAKARASVVAVEWFRGALQEMRRAGAHADGHGGTEKGRKEAFAAGLEAALIGDDPGRPHPLLPGSFMPPEHPVKGGRAFGDGWRLGRAMDRVARIVAGEAP